MFFKVEKDKIGMVPRRRRVQDRRREERIRAAKERDDTLVAMGEFPGRDHIHPDQLLRLAASKGAQDYRSRIDSVAARAYYEAVVGAFNGNERWAGVYLQLLRHERSP